MAILSSGFAREAKLPLDLGNLNWVLLNPSVPFSLVMGVQSVPFSLVMGVQSVVPGRGAAIVIMLHAFR